MISINLLHGPEILKIGHVASSQPLRLIFAFLLVSLVGNLHAIFEVCRSNRPRYMEGAKKFQNRSHDPFRRL